MDVKDPTRKRTTRRPRAPSADRCPQVSADVRKNGAKGHGEKPGVVRERAIVALLSAPTIELAAAQSGVNERTLRRWLSDDAAFKAEYDAARGAMFQAGMSRIQALSGKAISTLEDLLGANKYPAVQLGAARTIAELGMHQHDAETILRKLDAIEAAQRTE